MPRLTHKEIDKKILEAYSCYLEKENDKALRLCTSVFNTCTNLNYLRGLGGCHALFSNLFDRAQDWNKAIEESLKAYQYFEQINDRVSAAHQEYMLAYFYSQLEQDTMAINIGSKVLNEFIYLKDIRGEADTCSLLGTLHIQQGEYEIGLEYLERSLALKTSYNDLDDAGSDCINIAAMYLYKSDVQRAIVYLYQAIELKERYKTALGAGEENIGIMIYSYNGYKLLRRSNDKTLADAYLNLGAALSSLGNFVEAVDALDKALTIKQKLGDKYGEAVAFNQLGTVFVEAKDLPKAEWYFQRAQPLFGTLGHKQSEGTVWYNLGRIYLQTERLAESNDALGKAEHLFIGLDNPHDEMMVLEQKGALAIKLNKIKEAEELLQYGLELSKKNEAKEFEIIFLIQLVQLYEITAIVLTAIETCTEALLYAIQQKFLPQEANILQILARLHKKNGDYRQALEIYEQYHAIHEQIIHTETARYINGMQVIHETEIHRKNEELALTKINNLELLIKTNNQSILMYKKEFDLFKSDILTITKQLDKAENIIRKVKLKLNDMPLMQSTWESYLDTFSKVHPNFQTSLRDKFPDLTSMEIKICVLIQAGLHSEEISQILSISARTVENHRFNLRKKLGLGDRGNLNKFLSEI